VSSFASISRHSAVLPPRLFDNRRANRSLPGQPIYSSIRKFARWQPEHLYTGLKQPSSGWQLTTRGVNLFRSGFFREGTCPNMRRKGGHGTLRRGLNNPFRLACDRAGKLRIIRRETAAAAISTKFAATGPELFASGLGHSYRVGL